MLSEYLVSGHELSVSSCIIHITEHPLHSHEQSIHTVALLALGMPRTQTLVLIEDVSHQEAHRETQGASSEKGCPSTLRRMDRELSRRMPRVSEIRTYS